MAEINTFADGMHRLLLDELAGLVAHAVMDAQQVDDHQRQLRLSVVEHQAPRMEFVMDVRGRKREKNADDRRTQCRRDVARGRTGAKDGLGRPRRQQRGAGTALRRDAVFNL